VPVVEMFGVLILIAFISLVACHHEKPSGCRSAGDFERMTFENDTSDWVGHDAGVFISKKALYLSFLWGDSTINCVPGQHDQRDTPLRRGPKSTFMWGDPLFSDCYPSVGATAGAKDNAFVLMGRSSMCGELLWRSSVVVGVVTASKNRTNGFDLCLLPFAVGNCSSDAYLCESNIIFLRDMQERLALPQDVPPEMMEATGFTMKYWEETPNRGHVYAHFLNFTSGLSLTYRGEKIRCFTSLEKFSYHL
jgi:hypothetical protein